MIAYVDMLGYKELLTSCDDDEEFLRINLDMRDVIFNKTKKGLFEDYDVKIKMFSDNFIVAIKSLNERYDDYLTLKYLGYYIASVQLHLLCEHGILTRGAITKGKIYIDDDIVFGEGLIHAVELESKSKYPRVMIDKDRIDENISKPLLFDKCLFCDCDDAHYVDPYSVLGTQIGDDSEFCGEIENYLNRMRNHMIQNVSQKCYYRDDDTVEMVMERESIITKYLWILKEFNWYCNLFHKNLIIPVTYDINGRFMKLELKIDESP